MSALHKHIIANRAKTSLLDQYSAELSRFSRKQQLDISQINEAKLERLDALMRRIVESNFDGILTIHDNGQIGMANKSAADMFGYSVHELMHMSLDEILPGYRSFTDTRSEDYCVGHGHRETVAVHSKWPWLSNRSFPL